ncbi:hypothetical protein [Mycobacterium sp. 852002-50816_SCH5313054-b]|uniref:hypothetical protein n=1 Tax=Mycobacterium sp. 852002-50816_SCH5313054-b TaxID=1834092 RepID=UPI000A92A6D8|nr:hypothetical protein [Mycobacterium sp. 852002-50816_SCH5313054-b]
MTMRASTFVASAAASAAAFDRLFDRGNAPAARSYLGALAAKLLLNRRRRIDAP